MKTIDGVRYISAKEYAEMMNLTAGRVSQLKSELPFVKFEEFGIEVINFDLLSLSQSEKALAQAKFQTATPILELSYKDLGNYFGKFVMDLVNFKGSADSQISDFQEKSSELRQRFAEIETQKYDLDRQVSKLEEEAKTLCSAFEEQHNENVALIEKIQELNAENFAIVLQAETLSKEHQDLKVIQGDTMHQLEIKIIENKGLATENENLKARLAAMELSAKSDADFREEFKSLKELVMEKIK